MLKFLEKFQDYSTNKKCKQLINRSLHFEVIPLGGLGRIPERIKVDNGSEFISRALDKWAYENKFILDFSRPCKPTDNPFIESFNGSFRDECLNTN